MPIVHGFHPVREALRRRPHQVHRVLIALRDGSPRVLEIAELCARHQVRVEHVHWAALRGVAPEAGRGVAAEIGDVAADLVSVAPAVGHRDAPPDPRPASTVGSGAASPERDRDLVVLLEDVQDPRNLGALLRAKMDTKTSE